MLKHSGRHSQFDARGRAQEKKTQIGNTISLKSFHLVGIIYKFSLDADLPKKINLKAKVMMKMRRW